MQDRGAMINTIFEDLFDDSLLNEVYAKLMAGQVIEGMNDLILGLQARRSNASDQEWMEIVSFCMRHPLRDLLFEDPFTHRAYNKPRGYAGDAVLLDLVYSREERWPVPEGT